MTTETTNDEAAELRGRLTLIESDVYAMSVTLVKVYRELARSVEGRELMVELERVFHQINEHRIGLTHKPGHCGSCDRGR